MQPECWDGDVVDHEDPARFIVYTLEWKVTVNGRAKARNTEQDIPISPGDFWERCLREKVDRQVAKIQLTNRAARVDETTVTVSVNERHEPDLVKQFEELDVDWQGLERQLGRWSHLLRFGKRLQLKFSFKLTQTKSSQASKKGRKRGARSATDGMLAERALQLEAEENSTDLPAIWRGVYELMRCPGAPCELGPHCWRDDATQRHYKLNTYHLKTLIEHVQNGHALETHEDVPEKFRQWLYDEEKNSRGRHAGLSPRNARHTPGLSSPATGSAKPTEKPPATGPVRFGLGGARDEIVDRYFDWQRSQVTRPELKLQYDKGRQIVLDAGLDLEQVHRDQDPGFLVAEGIKAAIADRIVHDVEYWVTNHGRAPGRTESPIRLGSEL